MHAKPPAASARPKERIGFAIVAGVFFFFVLIKLGDPVIIDTAGLKPDSFLDGLLGPWPMPWGYWLLAPMAVLGLALAPWKAAKFQWPLLLPLAWLGWQFLSATQTVDAQLTAVTLKHFSACVLLFYLGYFGLAESKWPWPFLAGLALAFCYIIRNGTEQHFGGLDATRRYIYSVYGAQWPTIVQQSPDFAKRIASNRIFATFVYPNALAGGVLLLLPLTLVFLWQLAPKVSKPARAVMVTILGGCGLAILYWSGSKAGWLLAVVMAALALAHSSLPLKWRVGLIGAFVVLGLAGFAVRYTRYFEKGATSVSARFDYWSAACQTIKARPFLGTGPGTFQRPYAQLKNKDSEMARLCHNDYLEQGSDSGVVGMIIYCIFAFWSFFVLYRGLMGGNLMKKPLFSALSLGLIGFLLHSFVEYHLYIPALAWTAFFLLGWVWRNGANFPD